MIPPHDLDCPCASCRAYYGSGYPVALTFLALVVLIAWLVT